MEVAFISDIHTDFWVPSKIDPTTPKGTQRIHEFVDNILKPKEADILVFAGDNSHYNSQDKVMLEYLVSKKMYKKIFVTFGNHDMYLVSNKQIHSYQKSWNKVEELKSICEEIDTVEFLDGNIVEVDGVKIGGCGMWYDMTYGTQVFGRPLGAMIEKWKVTMNDANLIHGDDLAVMNPPRMYGDYSKRISFDPIAFFQKEKEKMMKIIKECDVFVTHIGPVVPDNLPPMYQNMDTGFYYFDGEYILHGENTPKLWIWGHTHDKYEFKKHNTWLMCNPLGYKSEKTGAEIEVVDLEKLH